MRWAATQICPMVDTLLSTVIGSLTTTALRGRRGDFQTESIVGGGGAGQRARQVVAARVAMMLPPRRSVTRRPRR
jgi:hypothetical protein